MQIIFSRTKPMEYSNEYGTKKSRPGTIRIHRLYFCCEEMADEVIQKSCSINIGDSVEIWFHGIIEGEERSLDHYARFCPFCGTKIHSIESEIDQIIGSNPYYTD